MSLSHLKKDWDITMFKSYILPKSQPYFYCFILSFQYRTKWQDSLWYFHTCLTDSYFSPFSKLSLFFDSWIHFTSLCSFMPGPDFLEAPFLLTWATIFLFFNIPISKKKCTYVKMRSSYLCRRHMCSLCFWATVMSFNTLQFHLILLKIY